MNRTHPSLPSLVALGFFSFLAAVAMLSGLEYLALRENIAIKPVWRRNVTLGLEQHNVRMTITYIDPFTGDIVAQPLRVVPTASNIPVRLTPATPLFVERRDAIIENGIVIGTTPPRKIPSSELAPGMRGIGIVKNDSTGKMHLLYFLTGEPFPSL